MPGAVEKIKDALHLRPSHGRHERTHDAAPTAGSGAIREEERMEGREGQHLHREEETHEHKPRLPAIGERLKVWMPFGKHDRHAPEERRDEAPRVLHGAVPSPAPPSGHEPIAPPSGVTGAPEFPPGPAGKVGFGTAGEGVAAVEDAQGGGTAPVSAGEPAPGATAAQRTEEQGGHHHQPRGPVCDSKTIRVVEERPIEKEIVETVIEHHPIEKEYVVETRPLGQHEIVEEVRLESLGVRERVIAEGKPTVIGAGVEPGPPTRTAPRPDAGRASPQQAREEQHEIIRPRMP